MHLIVKHTILGGNLWLDLTVELIEGVWSWQNTGQAVTYSDWGPTEPNSYHGSNEDCVVFSIGEKCQWAEVPCSFFKRLLCEKKVQVVFAIYFRKK